jgi:hypothetical protein
MTYLGSHEFVEAATDPFLDGFQMTDDAWTATHGSEACDLCLWGGATKTGSWDVELGFSNAAAKRGLNPCVPKSGALDFNLAPADGNATLHLSAGASTTLDLVGFSEAPMPPWRVDAEQSGGTDGELTLTLDHARASNGAHLKLTVTLGKSPSDEKVPFMIRSQSADGTRFWPGVVIVE